VSPLRTPLIAGNWKMHHGGASGVELAVAVARAAAQVPGVLVVVAPPLLAIVPIVAECAEVARQLRCAPVGVAAQNLYPAPKGAFTGEVSAQMLVLAGCTWVIVGHSERRQYFGEADDFVAKKVEAALGAGLGVIACVGETLEERTAGKTLEVVLRMVDAVAPVLAGAGPRGVIAYEPVWAIGTGKVATPADAQEVHTAIRARLATRDAGIAEKTRILYGGSVKADNASELLAQADVDGALVGGASLEIEGFAPILRAAAALV
jgi:triosephosphate isomerase (TIM)